MAKLDPNIQPVQGQCKPHVVPIDAMHSCICAANHLLKIGMMDEAMELLDKFDRKGPGDFELIMWCSRVILDSTYSADIFTGVSGDPGPKLIKALREAIEFCENAMSSK